MILPYEHEQIIRILWGCVMAGMCGFTFYVWWHHAD